MRMFFNRKMTKKTIMSLASLLLILILTFPLIWLILTSLKSKGEIFKYPPTLFPKNPTLNSYIVLFKLTSFEIYFKNSLIISLISSLIAILIGICFSYSLTRFNFKGSQFFSYSILIAYMLPDILLAIPYMSIWLSLGLYDTKLSLIISYLAITVPFSIWMLKSYFVTIPIELEEAAMVDGATRFQAFRKVVLPQAIPGIIATFIFTFILCWNEYLYALILLTSESNKTLVLGMRTLLGGKAIWSWGVLAASCVIMTVPVLISFIFIQRHLVAGFTAGALK